MIGVLKGVAKGVVDGYGCEEIHPSKSREKAKERNNRIINY